MRTNRKHKVLTFTFDEWAKIEKLAARCNMKTATFIKTSALKGKVFVIDLKENHDYVVALNRIGSNINQIARIANETGYIHPYDLARLDEFKEEICRISIKDSVAGCLNCINKKLPKSNWGFRQLNQFVIFVLIQILRFHQSYTEQV